MQNAKPVRSRSVVDNIMLVAVVVCVGIAIVRFALVIATVPYAVYLNQTGPAAARERIAERVAASRPWISWWGGRTIPYREGGDYLGVMSHHKTSRNIGCVIGWITATDMKRGIVFKRVTTPLDRDTLYGEPSGNLMKRADGTTFRTEWAGFARDSAMFSDAPVVEWDYYPVLTAEQAAKLDATAGLVERSRDFLVGEPVEGGSGEWILYARIDGPERRYVLIPVERMPQGGAQ